MGPEDKKPDVPLITIGDDDDDDDDDVQLVNDRKASGVWNFFTQLDNQQAKCNFCEEQFSYKYTTSNLRKHYNRRHAGRSVAPGKRFPSENEAPEKKARISYRTPEGTFVQRRFVGDPSRSPQNPPSSTLGVAVRRKLDDHDIFAFRVATKLRKMDEIQRLYCEKIINDALYKGALKQLSIHSEIVSRRQN